MTLIAWQEKRRNYNHKQKSWDTFAFLGVFQFTQAQPLPSPHKQCWEHVSMDGLDKTSAAFGIEISIVQRRQSDDQRHKWRQH